jgi:thioredoxin 1
MIEVIKFGAEWCGPCRMMKPAISELSKKYNVEESDIKITEIDVDKNPEMSEKYSIRSIPTVVFEVEGSIVQKKIGAVSKDVIESVIFEISVNK